MYCAKVNVLVLVSMHLVLKGKLRVDVDAIGKWATIALGLFGALWKVDSFVKAQAVNSRRPFLDLQLKLYTEAIQTTEILATSSDENELKSRAKRFWELYWGELGMVENGGLAAPDGGVEGAMVRFGNALRSDPANKHGLQLLSLALAHTLRNSLATSWGVKDWRTPIYPSSTKVPQSNSFAG
jgi:hypothetical protein